MPLPAYTVVAARLRQQIEHRQLPPGDQLPAERELCEEFAVSRITIRHALRLLAEEGLLQRRHGSGTYVKPNATRRIPLLIDYTGSMRDHAPKLRRQVLSLRWERADLLAERVDKQDGIAVAWDEARIYEAFAKNLTKAALAHVDFLETWMKCADFQVHSCRQQIEAVAADALTAKRLALPKGAPVLKSTEIYSAAPERPAGLFISYYHPQHICITSRFRWHA